MTNPITHPSPFTRRSLLGGGLSLTAAVALAACGANSDPLAGSSGSAAPAGETIVGGANFSENQILGSIYSQALVAKGLKSSTKLNLKSREVYIPALKDGSISVIPEYTGNLLAYLDPKTTAKTAAEVEAALPAALGDSLKILQPSNAVDQDVYVVTQQFAQQNGLTSLADLTKVANLTLGGPTELQQRTYGPKGLKSDYGVDATFKAYDSPAVKVKDLLANKIQVADFFTTDAAIKENNLVELTDPKSMILPQNVIPLIRADLAQNNDITSVLNAISAKITTEDLTELVKSVDTDNKRVEDVAKGWLSSVGLG